MNQVWLNYLYELGNKLTLRKGSPGVRLQTCLVRNLNCYPNSRSISILEAGKTRDADGAGFYVVPHNYCILVIFLSDETDNKRTHSR